MPSLFLHCRPGFEGECAAEIQDLAATQGISGYCKAKAQSAYVIFQPHDPQAAARLHAQLPFKDLIFARQWFVAVTLCNELPVTDRVTALIDVMANLSLSFDEIMLETPDTNEGKALSVLCRALERPLREALAERGCWRSAAGADALRFQACLLSGTAAYVGYALAANSASWPMGIPRLKFPRGAPSRSTLKLEEALLYFLTTEERDALLQPGMTAVDLGAAPGGWTWQLARRHLRVTAVDNGELAPALPDSGVVEHIRADGFRFQPPEPVDWLVCDIVEQPVRIAELAARWLVRGWCNRAIFNLKLPMKKRYQEVRRCLARIDSLLRGAGIAYDLSGKQLYHDREEITLYIRCRPV
jgi:23S rRNA (cytidine2498-2'-O)-methyltransferase